jgi:hypothetical protein
MSRYYPGATVTVTTEVRDSAGVLTDAADITMVWKRGLYGTETSETPTNTGTGLYSASFVPEAGGNHYVRWDTGKRTFHAAREGRKPALAAFSTIASVINHPPPARGGVGRRWRQPHKDCISQKAQTNDALSFAKVTDSIAHPTVSHGTGRGWDFLSERL